MAIFQKRRNFCLFDLYENMVHFFLFFQNINFKSIDLFRETLNTGNGLSKTIENLIFLFLSTLEKLMNILFS